jgi:hypothetical protein
VPPWVTELPAEVRRKIELGVYGEIPPRFRTVIERYLQWLRDNAQGKAR